MNIRRYILAIILIRWIKLDLPPKRIHLLYVPKRYSRASQQIPLSVVSFNEKQYLVGLESTRQWVQNIRVAKQIVLQRGRRSFSFRPVEIDNVKTAISVLRLYLEQEPYTRKFLKFTSTSNDNAIAGHWRQHPVFELLPP